MSRAFDSAWHDDLSDDDDTTGLIQGPVKTYEAAEQQTIRDHEEGLNKLGEVIKRQKHMANEIAVEVDVHNEILDQIDTGLVNTNENLRKNTRNIKLVTQKSSTFCLWVVIILLGALIIGLAFL